MPSTDSKRKALLSLSDLNTKDVQNLAAVAYQYGKDSLAFSGELAETRVGLLFTAPSTRTRVSFWSAARTLGCEVLHMNKTDLQISTGEAWKDTATVLANFLDVAVVRTNGPQQELAEIAVHLPATINALTYFEHPTQAIADFCAMQEHFGQIEGLRLAYLGEVNNTARSLAVLVSKTPMASLDIYSPDGHGFSDTELDLLNASEGTVIRQHHQVPPSPNPVDVIYTTRWQSMGVPHTERDWVSKFTPFAVTKDMLQRFAGECEPAFMHDLPAVRGQEVEDDILDGRSAISLVQRQAYHKASAAASALLWSTGRI